MTGNTATLDETEIRKKPPREWSLEERQFIFKLGNLAVLELKSPALQPRDIASDRAADPNQRPAESLGSKKMTAIDLLIYRIFTENINGPLARNFRRLVRLCNLKKEWSQAYADECESWQALDAVLQFFSDSQGQGYSPPFTIERFRDWCNRTAEYKVHFDDYEKVIDAAAAHFSENPETLTPESIIEKITKRGVTRAHEHAAFMYGKISTTDPGNVYKGDKEICGIKAGLQEAIEEQQRLVAKIAAVFEEDYDDAEPEEKPLSLDEILGDEVTLEFPEHCLYGRLGEMARQLEMPLGLAYPALGVCYSIKPNIHVMADTRINLFGALIAEVGHGKDQVIDRAIKILNLQSERDYGVDTIGGDFQLAQVLGSRTSGRGKEKTVVVGPAKRLLITQEIGDILIKTGAEGSTLAKRLQYLWDHNEYSKPDRQGKFSINCRLSWLGGVTASEETPEEFTELFGSGTTKGLYSRFIFGYSGKKWKWEKWECPNQIPKQYSVPIDEMPEVEELARAHKAGCTVVEQISPAAEVELNKAYLRWEDQMLDPGRLVLNAKKWAIITASANGEEIVTVECMEKAITFMKWQAVVRKKFLPSIADERNPEAKFVGIFLPAFSEDGADKKFLQPWKTITDRHWHRKKDGRVMMTAIENLITMGVLIPEAVDEDETKRGRRGKFPRCKINPKYKEK
jgi:hypothetical protein